MKKDIAMKWVKALRSGKYKQGEVAKLQDENGGFCCLGVLCEVMKVPAIKGSNGKVYYEGSTSVLFHSVLQKVGLKSNMGNFMDTSLASLNDGTYSEFPKIRFTFDEIADLIQINYEEL